jgi:hypothetical protein
MTKDEAQRRRWTFYEAVEKKGVEVRPEDRGPEIPEQRKVIQDEIV